MFLEEKNTPRAEIAWEPRSQPVPRAEIAWEPCSQPVPRADIAWEPRSQPVSSSSTLLQSKHKLLITAAFRARKLYL
jgi:hypothetical protein